MEFVEVDYATLEARMLFHVADKGEAKAKPKSKVKT